MKQVTGGALPLDAAMAAPIERCLGCLACMSACPSGVRYDVLLEGMRAALANAPVPVRPWRARWLRGLLFALFPYPRRLRLLLGLQLLYVWSGLRGLLHRIGVLARLPRALATLDALMPRITWRQAAMRLAPMTPARSPERARVALFPGCVQQVYFPEVNAATVRVLAAEGCTVAVPAGIGCCGALSLHDGRSEEARRFARAAIARLEAAQVDAVVVNAAGCGAAMKHWGRLLAEDPAWAARAQAMATRVKDITEFLVDLGPIAPRRPVPLKAAYHDACHLAHGQGIRLQPRQLLGSIPGLELVEIPGGDQCCGSAGLYNVLESESAHEIGARKVDQVLAAEPALLISGNPGCTLHIARLLRERGTELATRHPIEVLADALE